MLFMIFFFLHKQESEANTMRQGGSFYSFTLWDFESRKMKTARLEPGIKWPSASILSTQTLIRELNAQVAAAQASLF